MKKLSNSLEATVEREESQPLQAHAAHMADPAGSFESSRANILFIGFCVWTFVLLCRPQDLFPHLLPERPVLVTGILMVIIVVLRLRELGRDAFFQERQAKLFTMLVAVMVLGMPFAIYRRLSFEFIFTGYVNVVLFFYLFYKVINSVNRLRTVILVGCLGNGLYLAYAVATGIFIEGRLFFGGMFDANDLAFFTLSFLPLNLIFISRENPLFIRLACILSFGVGLTAILLTGSRGGFLALAIVFVMFLFKKSQIIKVPFKIAVLVSCLILLSFSDVNMDRYKTLLNIKDDYNITDETGRIAIWETGVRLMLKHPITGVGVQNFSEAIGDYRDVSNAEIKRWQGAHNMVIQIGAEAGIIGLILFLTMSHNVFRILGIARKDVEHRELVKIGELGWLGFLGLFVSGMFLSQAYSLYWAFYVALSAVISHYLIRGKKLKESTAME